MKKAVLYCRNAVNHHDNHALETQEQILRNYAIFHGYEVADVVKEVGSGRSLKRLGITNQLIVSKPMQ